MSRSRAVLSARDAAASYRRCADIAQRGGDTLAATDYAQYADDEDRRAVEVAHGARRDPRDAEGAAVLDCGTALADREGLG